MRPSGAAQASILRPAIPTLPSAPAPLPKAHMTPKSAHKPAQPPRRVGRSFIRNAIQAGYTTVIVPTGGLEQNGPHMVIGKHDYIVSEAARQIAKDVGRVLVAPVVAL